MYYLTPMFHIKAVVPPFTVVDKGLERDANGKVFDRAHLYATHDEAYAKGLQLCKAQDQRIRSMRTALDMKIDNLAASKDAR